MVNMPRPPFEGGRRLPHQMHGSPFFRSFGHPNHYPRQGPRFGTQGGFRGPQQFQRQPMNQMGLFRGMQQPSQGGGLLSRLFGGGRQGGNAGGMQALRGASQARGIQALRGASQAGSGGGGSFLQTLANPGAINGFLNNTQQMLKTAQSIGPMVQQYGPMVRNLPAMWKLYRGLKNADVDEAEETPDVVTKDKTVDVLESSSNMDDEQTVEQHARRSTKSSNNHRIHLTETEGASIPKLYI